MDWTIMERQQLEPKQASRPDGAPSDTPMQRPLSPNAQRALAEAAERRRGAAEGSPTPERGGRGGLEPVRFGDWEVKGLASDF